MSDVGQRESRPASTLEKRLEEIRAGSPIESEAEDRMWRLHVLRSSTEGLDADHLFLLSELARVEAARESEMGAREQMLIEHAMARKQQLDAAIARAEKAEATREEFRALNLRALANERDALGQVERLREALAGLLLAVRHWSGPAPKKVVVAGLVAEAALAATEPKAPPEKDDEDLEQCPSEWNGLQCCNLAGHEGQHEHRDGPLTALVRTQWPATTEGKL